MHWMMSETTFLAFSQSTQPSWGWCYYYPHFIKEKIFRKTKCFAQGPTTNLILIPSLSESKSNSTLNKLQILLNLAQVFLHLEQTQFGWKTCLRITDLFLLPHLLPYILTILGPPPSHTHSHWSRLNPVEFMDLFCKQVSQKKKGEKRNIKTQLSIRMLPESTCLC